ncbi:uncharacterized protein LOC132756289 isoform X2 [Ruditapes philippinarum]|uniref:uncharacterized protein LOC132756289 isoform X2 n=1 Tax=Ruditapes philippinarum TaxID=129788 RepID=UPI00295C05F8|nr:uncharacterized protein LOC132756289 isoform X2 [Ruditapes philippinarum]
MWQNCMSALLVVTVFGCLCLVAGTESDKDRRFIISGHSNSTHAPDLVTSNHTNCTHRHCYNGYCVQDSQQAAHCNCYAGWTGLLCYRRITSTGSGPLDHCNNLCGEHAHCTMHKLPDGSEHWRCTCDHGWHGRRCNHQTITAFTAVLYSCDHIKTIVALAYQTPVSNPNAAVCSQGQHTSHEAFVLTECDVPKTPATWSQGLNVMSSCARSNPIPDNTLIASFDHGIYSSDDSLSGIFLGCTRDGFKIAYQTCGQSPEITEIRLGESFNRNPNNFYAIS